MKKILIIIILLNISIIVKSQLDGDGTYSDPFSGTLECVDTEAPEYPDTTWSGTVYIDGDITIDDEKLTISAGAIIIFLSETADLIITGTGQLEADGTPGSIITFTSDDDDDGNYGESGERWGHISFESSTGSSTISFCIIEYGNKSGSGIEGYGGGIQINSSVVSVAHSTIRNNYAQWGGGIFVNKNVYPSINNCYFIDNQSLHAGGGLYSWSGASPTITNCIFETNASLETTYSNYSGGGIGTGTTNSIKIINCTFVNNTSSQTEGQSLVLDRSPNAKVINSIFWGTSEKQIYCYSSSASSVINCAYRGITYTSGTPVNPVLLSSNNDASDGPNFNATDGSDWSIKFISPCRDTGTTPSPTVPNDYDGNPRIGTYDMGAYEVQYSRWTGATDTDWGTATNWDQSVDPSSGTGDVVIPTGLSNYPNVTTTEDFTIASGKYMILEPTASVTLDVLTNNGTLNLNSDPSGMFSLMVSTYSGSGTVNSEIYFTGGDAGSGAYRWHYMAVPKTMDKSELLSDISSDNLLLYDDSEVSTSKDEGWQWHDGYGGTTGFTNLEETKGYNFYHWDSSGDTAMLTSTSLLSTISNIYLQFSGSGLDTSLYGWNLVGNSLTCALDWDNVTFSGSDVRDAVYYTKDNAMMAYVDGFGVNDGDKYVPPLQGFFVKTTATSQYITLSSAKTHATSQSYYKKGAAIVEKPHFRVEISQEENKDEMVIRFETDATNNFDGQYDASKWISPAAIPQIYTLLSGEDYCINALPYPETSMDIPVGIKIPADGTYSIKRTDIYGLEEYNIYLKDLQEDVTINLKDIPEYSFSATSRTTTNRFIIIVSNISTATDEMIFSNKEFNIYSAFGLINIQTLGDDWNGKQGMIKIFDLAGKTIDDINNAEFDKNSLLQIRAPETKGLYLVEIKAGVKRYVGKVVVK